jgi:hypothetical protein
MDPNQAAATRRDLDCWVQTLPQPRTIAKEATIFTGWIYDHLLSYAEKVKVAHPLMLRAIAAAKKKNDKIDASKIADCLRCDFLPECHMAPTEIRDRRRVLRYRNLVVKQMVQMKNRVSGLPMETGVSYNKQRLLKVGNFSELMSPNGDISEAVRPLLNLSRGMIRRSGKLEYDLVIGGRAQAAGFRACRRTHPDRGSVKTFLIKEKNKNIGIYRSAGCQVSLVGD